MREAVGGERWVYQHSLSTSCLVDEKLLLLLPAMTLSGAPAKAAAARNQPLQIRLLAPSLKSHFDLKTALPFVTLEQSNYKKSRQKFKK
jgi:hypothetical protein